MDGTRQIQLCRRQQRSGSGPPRWPDRSSKRRAQTRRQDARHLRAGERSPGLPSLTPVSLCETQARRLHRLHRRRHSDRLGLVTGAYLVNAMLLGRGDTVIVERDTYQGALTRLTRLGVDAIGIPLDGDGMRMDILANTLADLKRRNITPKYIYTIPTVQNPTGTIMPEGRRVELLDLAEQYGVPIFEDDCYADLIWDGHRPPALYCLSKTQNVIHIGSFSKSIAPALRVGFIVAPWGALSRMLALKTDAGSGALEQMVLAEYCVPHFARHVGELTRGLHAKLDTLTEALSAQFGTSAEFEPPKAGSRLRLCFASPSHEQIREGIAILAEICRREFGVPERIANVTKQVSP